MNGGREEIALSARSRIRIFCSLVNAEGISNI